MLNVQCKQVTRHRRKLNKDMLHRLKAEFDKMRVQICVALLGVKLRIMVGNCFDEVLDILKIYF